MVFVGGGAVSDERGTPVGLGGPGRGFGPEASGLRVDMLASGWSVGRDRVGVLSGIEGNGTVLNFTTAS